MPLLAGKRNIGHNIAVESESHPHKQAVAIALDVARRKLAEGGATGDDSIGSQAVGLAAGMSQPSFRKKLQGITDDWSYRPKAKTWESTFNVKAPEDPYGYIPFSANAYHLDPDDSPISKPVIDVHKERPMEFNFENIRSGYGSQQNKFGIAGIGHAKEVISQASRRAVGALQKLKPPMMIYSAAEPSRASLYEHLTRNLSVDNYKGYRLNIPGEDRAVFAAIRQDNPSKLIAQLRSKGIEAIPLERTSSRQGFAEGGNVSIRFHSGPIHSSVAGRTDHLPITVESGSYVLPADIVSAGGEGNTIAGFKVLRRTFGGEPYGQSGAPYGQSKGPYGEALQRASGGSVRHRAAGILFVSPDKEVLLMRRTGKDHAGEWALPAGGIEKDETPAEAAHRETEEEAGYSHDGGLSPFMHSRRDGVDFVTFLAHCQRFKPKLNDEHDSAKWVSLAEAEKLPLHPGVKAALEKLGKRAGKARGGEASGVPIVAAGGEWVIPPHHVEAVGGGDIDMGHRVLDGFVKAVRKELIGTLQKLPGPRKD